ANGGQTLHLGADAWVVEIAKVLHVNGIPVLLVDTNYTKCARAKMQGLSAVCTNVLNEHEMEQLELTGIGRFLAVTNNDEVNTLAVREFQHHFGRENSFQLGFKPSNSHHRRGVSETLAGRVLFDSTLTHTMMREMFAAGAMVKATTLSDTFDYEKFCKTYQDDFTLMFVLKKDERLRVNAIDSDITPEAGDTLITLITQVSIPEDHAARNGNGNGKDSV
ncbi:MAG: NAD-binding protein, partial [Planctomycetota bacterium]